MNGMSNETKTIKWHAHRVVPRAGVLKLKIVAISETKRALLA
jgi:hypothetical protein